MKKLVLALAAVVALAWFAAPASAFTFLPGLNEASFVDFSAAFNGISAGRQYGVPSTRPPVVGSEVRSVFWVDALKISGGSDYHGGTSPELTGMVYDLKCLSVQNVMMGSIVIAHVYSYGAAGTYADTFTGRLDLYADNSNDKTGFPGPNASSNPANWSAIPNGSAATARDSFPSYSNGDLLLSATFLPLPDIANPGETLQVGGQDVLLQQFFFANESGFTPLYAHLDIPDGYNFSGSKITSTTWLDGTYADGSTPLFYTSDLRLYSNYALNDYAPGQNLWPVQSHDPVQFNVASAVPEPATLGLLGTALVGLIPAIRRRK